MPCSAEQMIDADILDIAKAAATGSLTRGLQFLSRFLQGCGGALTDSSLSSSLPLSLRAFLIIIVVPSRASWYGSPSKGETSWVEALPSDMVWTIVEESGWA